MVVTRESNESEGVGGIQPNSGIAQSQNAYKRKQSDRYHYPMGHGGVALLFNHETFDCPVERRDGTFVDVAKLEDSFREFGFSLKPCIDYDRKNIRDKIQEVSEMDHTDKDCLLILCLTHGEMTQDGRELIFARDGSYPPSLLWLPFSDENCPSLAGKPKIIIIQACRGEAFNTGEAIPQVLPISPNHEIGEQSLIPNEEDWAPPCLPHLNMPDLLVARCTFVGFRALRDSKLGSIYIRKLVSLMSSEMRENDVLTFLTKVNREVAKEMNNAKDFDNPDIEAEHILQIPCFTSTLTKLLYFP